MKVAINGFGRIGRAVLRAWLERQVRVDDSAHQLEFVAIGELHDMEAAIHLLSYDSTYGKLPVPVESRGDGFAVGGSLIRWFVSDHADQVPWGELSVDLLMDCSGAYTDGARAASHLDSGARRVLISAPATNVDKTVVYGVNHRELDGSERLISNASCTTNGLALIGQLLHRQLGIEQGLVTITHCSTNDQSLQDQFHTDLRLGRAAGVSIIPTPSGAATCLGQVLPELSGRLSALSLRVPTQNVSLLNLTFNSNRPTSVNEVNGLLEQHIGQQTEELIQLSREPLVSVDFNHCSASLVVDTTLTEVSGKNLVRVCGWLDNEWGFANRMIDVAGWLAMQQADSI